MKTNRHINIHLYIFIKKNGFRTFLRNVGSLTVFNGITLCEIIILNCIKIYLNPYAKFQITYTESFGIFHV